MKWRGWVSAPHDAWFELRQLGITLGPYSGGTFVDCVVPDAAIDAMEQHWGEWVWGLTPAEEE